MKTQLVTTAALALCVSAAGTVFDFEKDLGGGRYDRRYAKLNTATPLSGSGSLEINTRQGGGEWNAAWSLPKGILKSGESYRIRFRVKVLEKQQDAPAHLLVLARPLSASHGLSDAGMVTLENVGKEEFVTFRLNIPKAPDDYSLQFHTHFKVHALVDEITVTPAKLEAVPAQPQAEPAALPEKLPSGAREFQVDPAEKRKQKIFNAKEFGVSADSPDNTAALQKAIDAVRRKTPAKLVLDPGVYRFGGDKPVLFDAITDFEFDGQGATLLFQRTGGRQLVAIHHCMRSEFRNFTIDWDWESDPLASVVKLESVSPKLETVRVRFLDCDRFPKQEVRAADLNRLDPATRRPDPARALRIPLEFYKGQNKPQVRWIEPNLLEITAKPGTFRAAEAGDTFLLRHYVYDLNGIDLRINRHLTLDNVTIASAPGMGILTAGAQHHWQLLNSRIVPPAGSKRPCGTTADAMHTTSSAGFFRMENCELGHSCDDTMNFHDLNGYAVRLDDRRVMATNLNYHPGDYFRKGDPIELCNADFSPTGFTAKAVSARRNGKRCEIEFAEKVPEGDNFIVLNRRFGTRNLIFRNNHIHDFPRGLLLSAEDVTIENNRFERGIASGIKLETGYTLQVWSEGYGVRNILIRNNRFDRVNPIGRYPNENSPDIYINSYLGTDPSLRKSTYPIIRDVWITGNEFIDSTGSPVYVCTADNVTVSGNRFVNRSELPVKSEARGAIGVSDSGTVQILNNVWESSLPGVKSGLLYDADTVKQPQFGGNTVK